LLIIKLHLATAFISNKQTKTIMKKNLLLALALALATPGFSQTDRFWSENNQTRGTIETDKAVARLSYPKEFKLFNLNIESLRSEVLAIVDNKSSKKNTIISLPNADGAIEQFEIVEASNFEPDLQAQFPQIRAYSGKGITDRYATLKLSISPQGIQTMVFRTDKDNEFMEPYSKDHSVYSVYRSHRDKGQLPWACSTAERDMAASINKEIIAVNATGSSTGQLKTMRLVQSCNAEYANYFGATSSAQVSLVLAAFNATLTRCNGVYEKDLALHLNLIANTTSVIYYNTSTDPYSTTLSQWNLQLQQTLTSVIGSANYDIGHMFGKSGGGGNAGCIGCVCVDPANNNSLAKGSGITSPADGIPQGDNFDIDYVVHEVGHQLGANHTFSMSNEGTGVNKEIGSGITIMGYAGITSQDVAPHSIDIYHEASIAQIQANLAGKTCPVSTNITANNAAPVIAAVSNYTIPISTPFALTGSATDANGDALTYCWEQNDNASSSQTGASSIASPTKATGPNWLSFAPTASGTRTFPKLSTILSGLLVTPVLTGGDAGTNIEALSSVSRTLNFRLTVRDNHAFSSAAPVAVGQTAFTDVVVTVSNTSGPFNVTAPNTAVTWAGGSTQTITWNVANTTASPVSCANVKISLSTDGGQTFPTVLIASTANDGSEALVIPATPSTTARIKVEAVGNIFFDISNTNFTIGGAIACGDATGLTASAIGDNSATVSWNAVSGAISYAVDYKLNSSGTWTGFATAQAGTSANLTGLTQGSLYDWRVKATCSAGSGNFTGAQFTTTAPCTAPSGLTSSAVTSSSATVSWSAVSGAVSYDVDYKLNSSGTWTNFSTAQAGTSANIAGLTAASLYDWRVRTNCSGGLTSGYTQAQFTTATASTCPGTYDVSTNGTVSGAALIPFNTDIKGLINPVGDIDYYKFVITTGGTATITLTTLPGDYDIRLYSSDGTTQLAISQNGGTTSETITRTYTAGTYYVRVYGYNNAFSASVCYTLKVQLGTAAKQAEAPVLFTSGKLAVFPNPVAVTANLSFKSAANGKASIVVTDQTGATVLTQQVNVAIGDNLKKLDVGTLANGVYFVKIKTGDTVEVARIVVTK
jgi:hypothetical protein